MNKLSIKTKLLVYNVIAQIIILIIFSFGLYKMLEISSLDKIQSQLKVIILDLTQDIGEKSNDIVNIKFHEQEEYKIKPLFFRFINLQNKKVISKNKNFPIELNKNFQNTLTRFDIVQFATTKHYIMAQIKIKIDNKSYLLRLATTNLIITNNLANLMYSFAFVIPIIFILLFIAGSFIIKKAFLPTQNILTQLKSINAKDLKQRIVISNTNDEIDMLSKEINNLLERLEISFEKISQFSSDASHELKTPLTIIRGELEVALRKDRDTTYYKHSIQECLDEVLNIQTTVDDLLFLAKNKYNDNIVDEIYVDEITIEAVNELKNYATRENIEIKVEIIDSFNINGDSKLLKVAIKNLLKNAIAYSYNGSAVTIKNEVINRNKIISVEDRGIGIKKDDQEKIFQHFYRTDKSRDKHSGGTGLGMSIVKKIVDIHKGTILLESKENIGTIVQIKL